MERHVGKVCVFWFTIILGIVGSSCENFLEVEPPPSRIPQNLIFADDVSATTAILGIYLDMYNNGGFASGGQSSIVSLAGLSSDELNNNLGTEKQFTDFEYNSLQADNSKINSLWTSMYKTIYQCNALLEALPDAPNISQSVKEQLSGEALFIRAFCHFYLVNCFGDIPLVLTTDYRSNASATRTPAEMIYKQIESDLLEAEDILPTNYVTTGRVRPNKFTATAMLARVYLYTQDWLRAEEKSTNVINASVYTLPANLNSVFLSASTEGIWQLKPSDDASYTNEGNVFGQVEGLRNNVLTGLLVSAFESNDARKAAWVTAVTADGQTRYLPFKYKRQSISTVELNEYSMVLRLAEQYLIRAEARAMQPGKLTGAENDVNAIRERAGLTPLDVENETEIMLAIEKERRFEFFAEWGHRWFDLKRWNRTTDILGPIKDDWSVHDELYPLPEDELRKNSKLRPQNMGY